ncbi:MAG TPA: DUF2505 family protein [Chthonomonas sp.]|jgi:ribosome-associated toxin RatA of RatAB toxin-antitoxin module|uniref:type II toxin-antitoxin system RatA family toxin n=1 Tax=Chthonomonas sp. TaxID=2282153 RepID=UPI002B4AE737|nr:DUF2505 family protein [Chthonomonas sp.]HLH80089.1 DUF2505 family protein [Chthonomonas sp.]
MPRIEQKIEIEAPVERVYAIARNVEAFPEFMADLQSLRVLERSEDGRRTVTEWVGMIQAVKMKVRWTQEDRWDDANHRDDFRMIQGDLDRMEGYWQFTPVGENRTRFESVVDYDINIPMVGPMVKGLVKKLMTENLQATLEAIKRRAESEISE